MSNQEKNPLHRTVRYDHSFVNRLLTVYTKPAQSLIRRHFERLDSSFLRLSNDFLWMNDDKNILAMMQERGALIAAFEAEIDQTLRAYEDGIKKHALPVLDVKKLKLKPIEAFDLELHSSASIDAVRVFGKLDQIFLLLEMMKQNALIDELAFIHTCNAWKASAGAFVKDVHQLRIRLLEESQHRLNANTNANGNATNS